jgi:hypothetical protein
VSKRQYVWCVCGQDNLHIRFGLCSTWWQGVSTARAGRLTDDCSCHTRAAATEGYCKADDISLCWPFAHVPAHFRAKKQPTCACVLAVCQECAASGTREDRQHSMERQVSAAGCASRFYQRPNCSGCRAQLQRMHAAHRGGHGPESAVAGALVLHTCGTCIMKCRDLCRF